MNIEANSGSDVLEVEENAGGLALTVLGGREEGNWGPSPAQLELRRRVLAAVRSPSTRRSYGAALDDLFRFLAGRPLSRGLLGEWRAGMDGLSASTVNVRLSAVRKLVEEAQAEGALGVEEAARLTGVPNVRQRGTRLGNWLTREQARELLGVPDRSTLKGKRDYCILSLLVGCALRRAELATLDVATIQQREARWVLADLVGKGGRVRTVAVPLWVKQALNAWQTAAGIEEGRLLRSIRKGGKKIGDALSDWAVWDVVQRSAAEIGIERFGAHDLRRTCASSAAKPVATSNRSNFCSDTPRSRPPSDISGPSRRSASRSMMR